MRLCAASWFCSSAGKLQKEVKIERESSMVNDTLLPGKARPGQGSRARDHDFDPSQDQDTRPDWTRQHETTAPNKLRQTGLNNMTHGLQAAQHGQYMKPLPTVSS